MGLCQTCCGKSSYEDVEASPESLRRNMCEAAERRLKEQESRGVHNPERVKKKQMHMMELERKQAALGNTKGETGLKWQVS